MTADEARDQTGETHRAERRWEWRWDGGAAREAADEADEPATYYEALTGRRDPHRDFFVAGRRILDAIAWTIALGLPVGALALTVLTGQDLQTIVLMTFAALVIGLMFKRSLPRA